MPYFWFFMISGSIAAYLAMSPKLKDSLVMNIGLVLISLGFFGSAGAAYDNCEIAPGIVMVAIGFFVFMIGVSARIYSAKFKRLTDWVQLKSKSHPRAR